MKVLAIFVMCLHCLFTYGQPIEEVDDGGRIVLGNNATREQFPYHALLRSTSGFVCGASLIHVRWFLTAAHCINNKRTYWIRVGSNIFDQGIAYPARKLLVHQSYNRTTLDFDIAMIKTDTVKLNTYVKVIALPTTIFPNNGIMLLSGFGRTSVNSSIPSILQWTTAMSSTLCGSLPEWKICIKANNSGGVCFGDSGGPGASRSGGVSVLQAVTSYIFSATCALDLPSVSARVSYFVPWIKNNIALQ